MNGSSIGYFFKLVLFRSITLTQPHRMLSMNIGGLIKTSLIDYPGMVCCVVFTQG